MSAQPKKQPSVLKNFAFGGLSGMIATCCIQPIDIVKVRLQLAGESGGSTSPFKIAGNIMKNEGGMRAFYKGLDSALLRQALYTTSRFGIFYSLSDYVKKQNNSNQLSFMQKVYCSSLAGGLGSIVGTPADLCLIRMQSDASLPVEQRRNYRNVGHAISSIIKDEGALSLWKGAQPTVIRAIALNIGMLSSYEDAKERLTKMFPTQPNLVFFLAGCISGAIAATVSLPFDNVKTKLQK
jgi:solute carrier family 25 oxoglutarate transporter 11